MSMDKILAQLLPELADLARRHMAMCENRGLSIAFTSGWRSPEEQTKLYGKGRAQIDGVWHVLNPHSVVTNALPVSAPHCRGAAYDVVPIVNEKAVYDRLDLFADIGRMGESLGLVWGGSWPKFKDMPHFELSGWRALPLKDA